MTAAEQKAVYTMENFSKEEFEEKFPIVRASILTINEYFMKQEPKTERQYRIKNSIIEGIEYGMDDFRRPAMDPSINEDKNLYYKKGEKPATGISAELCFEKAKSIMPEKNSRMGSLLQYDVFLGLLIKYLVEEKKFRLADAWKAVCDDSKDLGHYWNLEDAQHDFETTGKRKVWNFYDLSNTLKFVTDNNSASGFSAVSGFYFSCSYCSPLSEVRNIVNANGGFRHTVPWIVIDI